MMRKNNLIMKSLLPIAIFLFIGLAVASGVNTNVFRVSLIQNPIPIYNGQTLYVGGEESQNTKTVSPGFAALIAAVIVV